MHRLRIVSLIPFLAFLPLALGTRECESEDPPPPGVCRVGDRVYEDGDTGVPAPDGCNTCTCDDGRLTSCTERACPPSDGSCELGGVHYANGTGGIPAPDGCNTCGCEDGVLFCTELACPPMDGSCVVAGMSYPSGTTGIPAPDGCNTCSCSDGVLGCTERACPPADSCRVFGTEYTDGWAPAPDGCNTCSCEEGRVTNGCTEESCGPIPIAPCSTFASFPSDSFAIDSLSVEGDALIAGLSYSGGCNPTDYFRLCYGGFLESFPVQVELRLEHDAQGDACEAMETSTRTFDLTPLREAYREAYRTEHATVILRLGEGASYSF
jgi:hypothetical protein